MTYPYLFIAYLDLLLILIVTVSEWLLFNVNWAIVQLYHGKTNRYDEDVSLVLNQHGFL